MKWNDDLLFGMRVTPLLMASFAADQDKTVVFEGTNDLKGFQARKFVAHLNSEGLDLGVTG